LFYKFNDKTFIKILPTKIFIDGCYQKNPDEAKVCGIGRCKKSISMKPSQKPDEQHQKIVIRQES